MRPPRLVARLARVAFLVCLCALPAHVAVAEAPKDLLYQGQLLDASGKPPVLPTIQVRIFPTALGGVPLFIEDHVGVDVAADGRFEVAIGLGAALLGSVDADLFAQPDRFLELAVNGEVLSPRQPIRSAPFALHAEDAAQVQGVPVYEVVDGNGTVLGTLVGTFRNVEDFKASEVRLNSTLEVQTATGPRYSVDAATGKVADRREVALYFSNDCSGFPLLSVGDAGRIVEVLDDQANSALVSVPTAPVLSNVIPGSRSRAYAAICEPYVGTPLDDLVQTVPLPSGAAFAFPLPTPVTTRAR